LERQFLYVEEARQILLVLPKPRISEYNYPSPQYVLVPLLRPARPEDAARELYGLRYFYDIGIPVLRPKAPPGGDVKRWPKHNSGIVM
jgi:hypothetical protein